MSFQESFFKESHNYTNFQSDLYLKFLQTQIFIQLIDKNKQLNFFSQKVIGCQDFVN